MLMMYEDSVLGPVVSFRQLGFEHRTPTRIAKRSRVSFEKSSLSMFNRLPTYAIELTPNQNSIVRQCQSFGHAVCNLPCRGRIMCDKQNCACRGRKGCQLFARKRRPRIDYDPTSGFGDVVLHR